MTPISAREREDRPHISPLAWPLGVDALDAYEQEPQTLFEIDDSSFDGAGLDTVDPKGLFPRDDDDITTRWAKCPRHRLCNVATLLERKRKHLRSLEIWLGATVCGFDLNRIDGRLGGVTARSLNGNTLVVKADEFVVAAGSIESTRLLLFLDAQSDGRAFAGRNALGLYFQDHLKAAWPPSAGGGG